MVSPRKLLCHVPKSKTIIKKPKKLIDLIPEEIRDEIKMFIRKFEVDNTKACEFLKKHDDILYCEIVFVKRIKESDADKMYEVNRSNPYFQAVLYSSHLNNFCFKNFKNCFTYIHNLEERRIISQKF